MADIDVQRFLNRFILFCLSVAVAYGIAARADADSSVAADEPSVTFNLPAQSMSSALNNFAIQANLQMFFEEATVSGLQAPAVVGQMSPHEALHTLLANTQLEAVQNADGTYVVRTKRAVPKIARRAPAPAASVEAAPAPTPAPPVPAPTPSTAPIAADGPWMARLRGIYVDPKNESDPFATPPGTLPRDAVHVNGRADPELDLEYFFTPHVSTELSLAVPREHTFGVNGAGAGGNSSFGRFDWMPDVLTAKYTFAANGPVRPYLGAGVNVTSIWNVRAAPFGLSSTNAGPAAQAGIDLRTGPHWFFDLDLKWARVRPELRYGGQDVTRAKFDPVMYALGIGYRFGGASPAPAPASRIVLDSDGDGIPDDIDQCPNTPHGVAVDAKGCPLDSDHDGVPDYLDQCPGTPPGLKVDANGCEIEELILKGVHFETASAKLTADSAATLDDVVKILELRPNARAEIHGYTDSVGGDAYNLRLSERRAQSVRDYLGDHGIPPSTLNAAGFGKADPIASNATAEGRAQNRRVTVQFKSPVAR